ncbi:zinc finger CCCH domain-containing protein 18-like isoform X2 [Phalaenopsis equestris]|uniref:zinc finger CCCH domain-containing protein 18-like isoform X2 n=1 Tax=Phalaenopsis equestris TaxID=78828 RepID=UPI0009E1F133|nr:zinc finger CCCH domain-containing protein 18-like isoform X2 [Phalaenopsis equestris]
MEIENYTHRVLQRIHKIEPETATKIVGYLLLQRSSEEIMEYAMGDEEQIHSLIAEAKSYLISSLKLNSSEHRHPFISHYLTVHRPCPSPSSFGVPAPLHLPSNHQPFIQKMDHFSHNNEVWGMEDQLQPSSPISFDLQGNFYHSDAGFGARNRPQLSCHYFYQGYCKHGQSCKFSHGANPDMFNQMSGFGLNELTIEDNIFSPGCLEKLEMEIAGILKERRGLPVTIASLPLLYQEMYGKALQAEGYLTESQRHGKAGFSLTKLLAQLRNIRLMDRPHGQHFVVLAEDAPKYMEFISERNDHGASSSHQIYLTFPAESSFTDADVQNYFNQFGPVHDVRIPRQEKRMFGFVSFYRPQTVRQILAMGHPHIICGARVLVKPYKEKSRLVERKYAEKLDSQMCLSPLSFDMDNGLSSTLHSSLGQRACDTSQLSMKQQIEDLDPTFDLKRRQMPVAAHPFMGYGLEDSKFLEAQVSSLNIASSKSSDDDNTCQTGSSCSDVDRLQIQLPDSPFASPRFGSNSLYTVI